MGSPWRYLARLGRTLAARPLRGSLPSGGATRPRCRTQKTVVVADVVGRIVVVRGEHQQDRVAGVLVLDAPDHGRHVQADVRAGPARSPRAKTPSSTITATVPFTHTRNCWHADGRARRGHLAGNVVDDEVAFDGERDVVVELSGGETFRAGRRPPSGGAASRRPPRWQDGRGGLRLGAGAGRGLAALGIDVAAMRAGLPTTTALGGTSRVTTLPAPTIAWPPIFTPGRMVALAPIEAPLATVVARTCSW